MEHLHSRLISQDENEVGLEVEVANAYGPNTNGDAYPASTLQRIATAVTTLLDHVTVPIFYDLEDEEIGTIKSCFVTDDGRRLFCTASINLTAPPASRKDFSPFLPLTFSLFVRYTLCSGCYKVLTNVNDSPCEEHDFHIVPPEAIDVDTLVFGMVAQSAFNRAPLEEVILQEEGDIEAPDEEQPDIEWEAFRQAEGEDV